MWLDVTIDESVAKFTVLDADELALAPRSGGVTDRLLASALDSFNALMTVIQDGNFRQGKPWKRLLRLKA